MNPEQFEKPETPTPLDLRLAEQRAMAREQISAAWQIHVERVEEQLQAGWRDQIERVLEDRFSAIESGLREELDQLAEDRANQSIARVRSHSRREISERLNQTSRRLEQAETTENWVAALLDGACAFAARVALFSVNSGRLRFEGLRSLESLPSPDLSGLEISLQDAPAFRSVVETTDTVISLRTGSEISESLAGAFGVAPSRRVCLAPVLTGRGTDKTKVAAILYAESEGEPLDVNVLELLCSHGGAAFDCRLLAAQLAEGSKPGSLVAIAPVIPISRLAGDSEPEMEPVVEMESPLELVKVTASIAAAEPGPLAVPPPAAHTAPKPDWTRLSAEDQELHLRAQRFARVRVAEMRLYQPKAVKEGRDQGRLFVTLRGEMERSRAQFKHEFLHSVTMVDYFHEEILRTLANDDPTLLGPEYPGPLV
jgi:hypothetical protein